MSHFMHVHKYEFLPKKGHILNHTFKFKDYCPEVFRHLRERFGISDSDYLESFRCACTGNGHYHCNRRLRPAGAYTHTCARWCPGMPLQWQV